MDSRDAGEAEVVARAAGVASEGVDVERFDLRGKMMLSLHNCKSAVFAQLSPKRNCRFFISHPDSHLLSRILVHSMERVAAPHTFPNGAGRCSILMKRMRARIVVTTTRMSELADALTVKCLCWMDDRSV